MEHACFETLLTAVPALACDLASAGSDDIRCWADLVSFLFLPIISH
jgi:hypothetical protein